MTVNRTTPPTTRCDLRVVRAALDDLAAGMSQAAAAREHAVDRRTIRRWLNDAAAHPGWPTADDVAAWDVDQASLAAVRADRVAKSKAYRARVYLQRGPMHVPAIGTTRRLRALLAIGWTLGDLAERVDLSRSRLSHLCMGRRELIHRDTAARVAGLYDALSMTVPEDLPPEQRPPRGCAVRARQRRQCAAKGWPPPLAWDDDDLDNPAATPAGWLDTTEQSPAARRAAQLADLVVDGADLWEVLRALDLSRNTLQTWCARHGHTSTYQALALQATERAGHDGNQHTRTAEVAA